MKCPFCGRDNDKVTDSRTGEDGIVIRRRRECLACGRRFTTYERVAEVDLRVVKRNNAREPFDTEKIRQGLRRACWKRPVTDEQIEGLISRIEQHVNQNFENEITSRQLGEIVLDHLLDVDQVAYLRFASVYRQFEDIRDFVDAVQPILRRN
jgi:transcriptional repressor NrdR